MSVTDTNENINLKLNTKIKIAKTKIPKTFLCNRIKISVALEVYLKSSEISTKEYFCVYN